MPDPNRLRIEMRNARLARGVSLRRLGPMVGFKDHSFLSNIETGKEPIPEHVVIAYEQHLHLPEGSLKSLWSAEMAAKEETRPRRRRKGPRPTPTLVTERAIHTLHIDGDGTWQYWRVQFRVRALVETEFLPVAMAADGSRVLRYLLAAGGRPAEMKGYADLTLTGLLFDPPLKPGEEHVCEVFLKVETPERGSGVLLSQANENRTMVVEFLLAFDLPDESVEVLRLDNVPIWSRGADFNEVGGESVSSPSRGVWTT
jgi:hypothetical protein